MRLSFPNGDHADVLVGEGTMQIGGGNHNDVIVATLRERHARLIRDARGIVLEIVDPLARTHVNARPVREKAFLRYGDTLCLEAVTIALIESDGESDVAAATTGTARGVLRGMSGSWFGKSLAFGDGLILASSNGGGVRQGTTADNAMLARLDVDNGQLLMQSAEAGGSLVNGRRRERALLRAGDQLAFGRDRFVVECCSNLAGRATVDNHPDDDAAAPELPVPVANAEPVSRAIGWLLAAAAAMGLALAGVLARGT